VKILLSSHLFSPSVGGIETVSRLLAEEFVAAGHEVRVVTQTVAQGENLSGYAVFRRPSPRLLFRQVAWCDVFFHNNISLQAAWPLLLVRRPWFVAHHIWISRMDGRLAWQDRVKRRLLRFATNISISRAIAGALPVPSAVIPDPFQDRLFGRRPDVERDRELVFVGRLVSDKGADLLLQSLARLGAGGLRPRLTLVGDGPEGPALRALASELGLAGQVEFAGLRQGEELVRLLNRHQIMVVPSRWAEPFGVVALEGLASGCVLIGSEQGGLRDAIGPCGLTFPNGDVGALAERLGELLTQPARRAACLARAPEHLARHSAPAVAREYLNVFAAVSRGSRP
jgi:glycogen(starch) synthase